MFMGRLMLMHPSMVVEHPSQLPTPSCAKLREKHHIGANLQQSQGYFR
jgi:hypothetical protein